MKKTFHILRLLKELVLIYLPVCLYFMTVTMAIIEQPGGKIHIWCDVKAVCVLMRRFVFISSTALSPAQLLLPDVHTKAGSHVGFFLTCVSTLFRTEVILILLYCYILILLWLAYRLIQTLLHVQYYSCHKSDRFLCHYFTAANFKSKEF